MSEVSAWQWVRDFFGKCFDLVFFYGFGFFFYNPVIELLLLLL